MHWLLRDTQSPRRPGIRKVIVEEPRTLGEAVEWLTLHEGAVPLAGGQSIILMMNLQLVQPSRLVYLSRLAELSGVRVERGSLDLGSMCTHRELAASRRLSSSIPSTRDMFAAIGNARVRAMATVGGNLVHADPSQDPAVLLSALGASVDLVGTNGHRRVAVRDLATGPFATVLEKGEILARIRVPIDRGRVGSSYRKFVAGAGGDYPVVGVAAKVAMNRRSTVEDISMAAGCVGATVVDLTGPARALRGHEPIDPEVLAVLAREVRDAVDPFTDHRGSADYKRHMAGRLAIEAIRDAVRPERRHRRPHRNRAQQ